MKQNDHARKKRQLKNLSQKLERQWNSSHADSSLIQSLIRRIKSLLQKLSGALPTAQLKNHLGKTVAALVGVTYGGNAAAQSFASPVSNPFGLSSNSYVAVPTFADLDGDGDQDAMIGEDYGLMQYFENVGSAAAPQFAAPQQNPFGLDSVAYYALPQFMDLDNDGDFDLLVAEYPNGFKYFENTGTATTPQFAAPQSNPFGLVATTDTVPAVITSADLDDDGDLDILAGDYNGVMRYYENTGTPAAPQFAAARQNPFGLTSTYYYAAPVFIDLDEDGDMDLLVGEYYGAFQYFENTGTKSNPQFATPQQNPFGLTGLSYIAIPAFVDLDNDGDKDLIAADYYGGISYFENTSSIGLAEAEVNIALEVFPNPVSDFLEIKAERTLSSVEIINAAGAVVLKLDGLEQRVEVSHLPQGAYTLKVRSAKGGQQSLTFIKE